MARRSPKRANLKVVVNGQERDVSEQSTIAGLIESLGLKVGAIVVQRNDDAVERERYGDVVLAEGDSLELIRFVGGG